MYYKILKTSEKKIGIDSPEWEKAEVARVTLKNWNEDMYCPYTEARVLTNDEGLFVKFETDETELIYDYKNLNEDVFKDSCVEFFFKPDPENPNYFNFEINAIGTPLIGFGTGRSPLRVRLDIPDISIFEIETEFKEQGFILKYFIPYSFLLSYVDKIGDYFLGNFQKCKEKGDNPHYITYYPINTPKPNFHYPESFDKILIEK